MTHSNPLAESATQSQIPESEAQQIGALLSEIGTEAAVLCRLILDYADQAESQSFHALHTLAQKIGYLSDLGASKVGGMVVKGGAAEWFLPPVYHWFGESASTGAQQSNVTPRQIE